MNRYVIIALCVFVTITAARAQLVAYYPFDGGATDASGHGRDATTVNATYTSSGYTGPGSSGGAYEFNGSSNFLEIANLNINPSVYPQLTMGAWVLATSSSPIRQVISHDDSSYDRSLGIDYRGAVTGWSSFVGTGVLGAEPVTTGVWTFLAVVFDQNAHTATLYVNGNRYTATSVTSGSGWNYTRIGMNPSFGEYFAGTIDEVFFFASALNASQIDTIRLNGVAAAVPEPSTIVLLLLGLLGVARFRRPANRR